MSTHTAVDDVADTYVDEYCLLDPCGATLAGITSQDDRLTDLSPAGHEARADLGRRTLRRLDAALQAAGAEPQARVRLAAAQLRERVEADLELFDRGLVQQDLNVLESPAQQIRNVFSLMPTESTADWSTIGARLAAVPDALASYAESLSYAAAKGQVAASRQVSIVAERAASSSFFTDFVSDSPTDLTRAAEAADGAYRKFAAFLRTELLPQAPERDAVGRDNYAAMFRVHNGADPDLDEVYRWGLAEVAGIVAEQQSLAQQIVPGGTVAEAVAALNADPDRQLHGVDALRGWLQETSDRSVADLAGVHFDIPEPVRRIECMIAPSGGNAGAYYTPAAEDFSRPGRMWWSVPADQTTFTTWSEKSTVFHEGVPGHHLQFGQTAYRSQELNRHQRFLCWVSGHGEGWALYAERLMDELGYLSDPGDKLGMLEAQLLRAARVVIDIGMHLELTIPQGTGWNDGARWTPDLGWDYLRLHTTMPDQAVTDERNRYLGWPGQAPGYKVGERVWMQARAEAQQRHGSSFDLLSWHRSALDLGSMGLDPLRRELALI